MQKTTKIYVGNLPESATSQDLQGMFEKYGEVKECDVVRNYAFVHMSSEEEAKTAIEALHNSDYNGQKISVEISHSKVRQRPGMGGKGQCYRCGRNGHWSKECPRNPAARMGAVAGAPSTLMYPATYAERYPRYPMERGYGVDRTFAERSFTERMRPYPDPYERRPMTTAPQELYYRRPYEGYSYTRRSPPLQPPPPPPPAQPRYDFAQDTPFGAERLTPTAYRAPVY